MQLLVMQFKIKTFHIGFMKVLVILIEISILQNLQNIKIVLLYNIEFSKTMMRTCIKPT